MPNFFLQWNVMNVYVNMGYMNVYLNIGYINVYLKMGYLNVENLSRRVLELVYVCVHCVRVLMRMCVCVCVCVCVRVQVYCVKTSRFTEGCCKRAPA
mmetsp:Transcript_72847/g.118192  ORF Transcript_72847/g.118192 Transcript_72847/m.118192 type:complete len:97 (+) Transcript_72847:389-679(+)